MEREYETLRALREGGVIDLDGLRLIMGGDGAVKKGDLYVAERNTGPKLLTAKNVNVEQGWIAPTTNEYLYDIGECVQVKEA